MALIDARELIKMAKRDEDVGAEFYKALAERAKDEKLSKSYLEIREQELSHSKRFQGMLDELRDYVPREEQPGDYEEYYNSFLSKRSYMETDDAVEMARGISDDIEGIKFALAQEKNTLLFFLEMKELVPSNQHKEFIEIIIDEERGHITELSEMLLERME
jgi:rubrerythrin